jgi:hypothetical protein
MSSRVRVFGLGLEPKDLGLPIGEGNARNDALHLVRLKVIR